MKNKIVILGLLVLLVFTFWGSLIWGGIKLYYIDVWNSFFHPQIIDPSLNIIIHQVRIPRIILSLFVGAGLSVSGCVLQAILRNPLAEPYTLGVASGAAFGVSITTILGLGTLTYPIAGFIGALSSSWLVYLIALRKIFSVGTLILSGMILSYLFSAVVTLMIAITKPNELPVTLLWLMGDFSVTNNNLLFIIIPVISLGILILLIFHRHLDVLTLGEEKATYLGISPLPIVKLLFIITSLLTGVCIAGAGIIGFVGLLIPHLVRYVVGVKHWIVIISSALAGAIYLCICDTLSRVIIYPTELPVGVVTGIFGALFFLTFIFRRNYWYTY